jgi:hypothetical protein
VIKFSHITWRINVIVTTQKGFNYGLHLSWYISSWHFPPEEQKLIYRPVALKGLNPTELTVIVSCKLFVIKNSLNVCRPIILQKIWVTLALNKNKTWVILALMKELVGYHILPLLDTNIQNVYRLLLVIKATDSNSAHLITVSVMYGVCLHLTPLLTADQINDCSSKVP